MTKSPKDNPGNISKTTQQAESEIRDFAVAYPETHEDFPWGESAIKVRDKTFLFMRADGDGLSLSVKLSVSRDAALSMPFTEPTHYGLGKSGWITSVFGPNERPPISTIQSWIDESYRAVAPKKILALLMEVQPKRVSTKRTR